MIPTRDLLLAYGAVYRTLDDAHGTTRTEDLTLAVWEALDEIGFEIRRKPGLDEVRAEAAALWKWPVKS